MKNVTKDATPTSDQILANSFAEQKQTAIKFLKTIKPLWHIITSPAEFPFEIETLGPSIKAVIATISDEKIKKMFNKYIHKFIHRLAHVYELSDESKKKYILTEINLFDLAMYEPSCKALTHHFFAEHVESADLFLKLGYFEKLIKTGDLSLISLMSTHQRIRERKTDAIVEFFEQSKTKFEAQLKNFNYLKYELINEINRKNTADERKLTICKLLVPLESIYMDPRYISGYTITDVADLLKKFPQHWNTFFIAFFRISLDFPELLKAFNLTMPSASHDLVNSKVVDILLNDSYIGFFNNAAYLHKVLEIGISPQFEIKHIEQLEKRISNLRSRKQSFENDQVISNYDSLLLLVKSQLNKL